MSPAIINEIKLASLQETEKFGVILGEICLPGDIICLGGDLGAGKTTLTQSIAKGAGINEKEYVTSPTFAIMHEYHGRVPIYHLDLYRIASGEELLTTGIVEYFYLSGLTVIEWYANGVEVIPEDHLCIDFVILDEEKRLVKCSMISDSWKNKMEQVVAEFNSWKRARH